MDSENILGLESSFGSENLCQSLNADSDLEDCQSEIEFRPWKALSGLMCRGWKTVSILESCTRTEKKLCRAWKLILGLASCAKSRKLTENWMTVSTLESRPGRLLSTEPRRHYWAWKAGSDLESWVNLESWVRPGELGQTWKAILGL